MAQILFPILILLLAFPSGYLLAYLCRDELVQGRKWFKILAGISTISGVIFLFFNLAISLALIFMGIASFISYVRSYNRKFVKS